MAGFSQIFRPVLLTLPIAALLFSACGRLEDRLKEEAEIQGRASANASDELQRKRDEDKASAMEQDLEIQQRFYQGVNGTFRGQAELGDSHVIEADVRLTPTRFPYRGQRIRTAEEITADLNELSLHARVQLRGYTRPISQEKPVSMISTTCVFTDIRPDLERGRIDLFSPQCIYSFSISLIDSQFSLNSGGPPRDLIFHSREMSRNLLNKSVKAAPGLALEIFSPHEASIPIVGLKPVSSRAKL